MCSNKTSLENASIEQKTRHDDLMKQLTVDYLKQKLQLIFFLVNLIKMPHCQARSISREDFSNIFRGYDKVFGYSIFRLIFHKEIGILIRSIVLEYGLHLPSSVIKQCQPSFNRNPSAVVQLLEDVVEQCAENKPVDTASLLGKLISIPESETLKQLKIMRCNAGVAMDFVLKLGNSDNFTVALWLKSMKEASMSLSRHDAQMLEDSHRNYLKSLFSSSTSIKF